MRYYIVTIELLDETHKNILGITAEGHQLGIPKDPENLDYQAFLAWVAEGNTAEEVTIEP